VLYKQNKEMYFIAYTVCVMHTVYGIIITCGFIHFLLLCMVFLLTATSKGLHYWTQEKQSIISTLYIGTYQTSTLFSELYIMVELTGEGRACIPVGLTKTWDGLVNWTKCVWKVEEKILTGPGQPRTCSHPIYARTLTGVCQVVR